MQCYDFGYNLVLTSECHVVWCYVITIFFVEYIFFHLRWKKNIIELGSGNGSSKDMLKNSKIILTDIQKYSWISKKVDI